MERLGGIRCGCCAETQYEFLAFDHIFGGGRQERRLVKDGGKGTGTSRILQWLADPEIETKMQVLCHNCNQAKGYYGVCPHASLRTSPE